MNSRLPLYYALCVLVIFSMSIGYAGNSQKHLAKALPNERVEVDMDVRYTPPPFSPLTRSLAGTYTGLQGYFDYQVNAGACQYIRLDKSDATGNKIHVIFMTASDSADPTGSTRRTNYAYSSTGGQTWDTFNNLVVPGRRSGYPSLDMLQGTVEGVIIANHNVAGTDLTSVVFVDAPPGSGAFAELSLPPIIGGGDEPIWPMVAGTANSSIVMSASRSTANTGHHTMTSDFTTWSPWGNPLPAASAGLPTKANGNGRVAILLNTSFAGDNGIYYLESTDNGVTWPAQGTQIVGTTRIAGPDTFTYVLGSDLVYNGNNVLVAFAEANIGLNAPTDSAQITFWSQATGFVVAASKVDMPNVSPNENRATLNTITVDMPSIGMSGNAIVIAYQAMMKNDTAANGYNNNDIWMVYSTNGGVSWSTPRNLSNSPGLDDRFASVSSWNEPGFANIVWQEDPEAGGNIIGDPGATVRMTRQVFIKTALTGSSAGSGEFAPTAYRLEQNYPNPFNPSTRIVYSLPAASDVSLNVYNTLGQKVATLVNGYKTAGSYEVDFVADRLSSGVYYYTLEAGQFKATKKMAVVK